MLDTIILQIPSELVFVKDDSRFSTPINELNNSYKSYQASFQNPTAQDRKLGIYKPCLTYSKRGSKIHLKIQFSAPKLIFGNNLDELSESDFLEVLCTLQKRLSEMGLKILQSVLENAQVISFHPSKNIVLSNGYTSTFVINELKKASVSNALDIDTKDFRNNGHTLQFYSESHAFVIYDKIADLKKSKKRATDKDQIISQLTIFDLLSKPNSHNEILRLEVRLCKKPKMNSVLKQICYPPNPKFKDLFNKNLNQKIVSHYWNTFFTKNLFLFANLSGPQQIMSHLLSNQPEMKITEAIRTLGLILLCKDQDGIRGFRSIVDQNKPKTNWQVINKYLKSINDNTFQPCQYIQEIEQQIKDFTSYKTNKPP